MAYCWSLFREMDFFKRKLPPFPQSWVLCRDVLSPPPPSVAWFAGLMLCSPGPVYAGKAVKMSTHQSSVEKQWALEGHYPVTKHTPFMECWY